MDIRDIRDKFQSFLDKRDKTNCAKLTLEVLDNDYISIVEFYEQVLSPVLRSIANSKSKQNIGIWDEHMRSNVVRMAIELTYPYIVKKDTVEEDSPRALVFCIEEEYHELGARMTTDFLTLLGFDSYFIGANTPIEEALEAIEELDPSLVCISIGNFYNLIKAQETIDALRDRSPKKHSIVLGGYAVSNTPEVKNGDIRPDYFANSYSDLEKLKEEIK